MKGIDVSYANGLVDWNAVADSGINFAIVRTGAGKSILDDYFIRNVDGAHNAGLICGAYHYSYALTASDAINEAFFCRDIIDRAGILLELPIFFDMEDADGYKARHGFSFTRRNITAICKAFLDNIKLEHGLYASFSWLNNLIDWTYLDCPVWNAQWHFRDDFKGFIWQFTDSYNIGGQLFDANILYDLEHTIDLDPWL